MKERNTFQFKKLIEMSINYIYFLFKKRLDRIQVKMAEETHVNTPILLGTPSPSVYFAHTCVCISSCFVYKYMCVYIYI